MSETSSQQPSATPAGRSPMKFNGVDFKFSRADVVHGIPPDLTKKTLELAYSRAIHLRSRHHLIVEETAAPDRGFRRDA